MEPARLVLIQPPQQPPQKHERCKLQCKIRRRSGGGGWACGRGAGSYVSTLGVIKLEKLELGDIALEHTVQVPLNAVDLGHDGGLGKPGANAGNNLVWCGLPRLAWSTGAVRRLVRRTSERASTWGDEGARVRRHGEGREDVGRRRRRLGRCLGHESAPMRPLLLWCCPEQPPPSRHPLCDTSR